MTNQTAKKQTMTDQFENVPPAFPAFAEALGSYLEAREHGGLVDVTAMARLAEVPTPTAVTIHVWEWYIAVHGDDLDKQLDGLFDMLLPLRKYEANKRTFFAVVWPLSPHRLDGPIIPIWLKAGYRDAGDGRRVLTISTPENE